MSGLQGRRALVTGGGTGIGFGCAEHLLSAGAEVTIAGRRADVLADAVGRLGAGGRPVRSVECDITDEEQVRHAVEVAAAGENLDVLVANADSAAPGAILEMGSGEWEYALRLNVVGTALCIKHAALVMKEHGGGSIIAISSTSAVKVQPWMSTYNASKAGLDMLVRCAAVELAPHGVRVNSVQPGYTKSEMVEDFFPPALGATYVRATPLGRQGTPDDIGQTIRFLAGDDASWITGQVFGVDGGLNVPVMPSLAPMAALLYGEEHVRAVGLPDLTALNTTEGSA